MATLAVWFPHRQNRDVAGGLHAGRIPHGVLSPGWVLARSINTPQADKGQEGTAPSTAKPQRISIASTSKDKSIAQLGLRTSSTKASHRQYQGEAFPARSCSQGCRGQSVECETTWVTRNLAKGVVPQREESLREWARRRNMTATEFACSHYYIIWEEQRWEKLQIKGNSCIKRHSPFSPCEN